MGKRSANKRRPMKNGQKKVKTDWKCNQIPEDNELFRAFYELQLQLEPQEFDQFWKVMKTKLPVVFRVNPNCPNYQSFVKRLKETDFVEKLLEEAKVEQVGEKKEEQEKNLEAIEENPLKLELIKWYPGEITFQMNTNKNLFKKTEIYNKFHKYLQKSFDSGLISRQELVSMLPPLYLDVKSTDVVLDMCAAPGSKTSQILEMVYGEKKWLAKGCVIANDADYRRAHMLIHQLHRFGTCGMAVINHPGQFLPELYTPKINHIKEKFQFDKILCDVPCSGDGATRKLPIKWLNWHTSDGLVLHPLQLSILMKSINLLKKGGLLVYSTCSLNPIEDEAVLNALFEKVSKGLEIVDVHPMFGVKGRRGLLHWKVCGIQDNKNQMQEQGEQKTPKRTLKVYENYAQGKENFKVKSTMFPPELEKAKQIGLDHSMRILPHDQDTGGFFIALLKKHNDFEWNYQNSKVKEDSSQKQGVIDDLENEEKFVKANLPEVEQPIVGDDLQPIEQNEQESNQQKNQNQKDSESEEEIIQKKEEKVEEVQQGIITKTADQKNNDEKPKSFWKQKKEEKKKGSKYQKFEAINEQDFETLQKFYGLDPNIRKLLFVREQSKKVILVSQGVRALIQADIHHKINFVNMGCKIFQRGKESFAGLECLYRLCQDGIHFLMDSIKLRKVKVTLQFFKSLISINSLNHEEIQDKNIHADIRAMTQGSFCIYIQEVIDGEKVLDAMIAQNFKNSLHIMVSKEDMASLSIRYL